MSDVLAIGIDLGATKIASALVDRAGCVIASRQTPTLATEGPAAACERMAGEVRALIDAAGNKQIAGIGIGSPGLVDSERGVVRWAVNLSWRDIALAEEVSRQLGGVRTFIENDANVNAVGEGMFGSAIGSRDFVLLTIGSGLGCGTVTDGRLLRGAHNIAGDLGHFSIDPVNGRPCPCGKRGCAETIVSGPGLVAAFGKPDITPDAIVASARSGDARAAAAVDTLAEWLGQIAAVAAAVINPDTIIIGGGLGVAAFDLVCETAEREMYRRISPTLQGSINWRVATLQSPAIGAAAIVWSKL